MKCFSSVVAALLCFTGTSAIAAEGEKAVIASGDDWSYYSAEGEPDGNWKTGSGTRGWKSGPTRIGWGETGLATVFTAEEAASIRFPVAYFRKHVQLSKTDQERDLQLIVGCDDGCIAYLNGVEIGRARMPKGHPKPYTADTAGMSPRDVFPIPRGLLKADNVFSVEVYQHSPESSDMRFEATVGSR